MDRGADGNPPSSSEKEVNGNIDNLSPSKLLIIFDETKST